MVTTLGLSGESDAGARSCLRYGRPDARCDQIIEVAAVRSIRDGYVGASMSAVAGDAGVARPLVYHSFRGKSALLKAVLMREAEALLEAMRPDPECSARAG